jgi:hypothetical protein
MALAKLCLVLPANEVDGPVPGQDKGQKPVEPVACFT